VKRNGKEKSKPSPSAAGGGTQKAKGPISGWKKGNRKDLDFFFEKEGVEKKSETKQKEGIGKN